MTLIRRILAADPTRKYSLFVVACLATINTIISFDVQVLSWIKLEHLLNFSGTNRDFLSDWNLYIQAASWHTSGLNVYTKEFFESHGSVMGFLYPPPVINALGYIFSILGEDRFRILGVSFFIIAHPMVVLSIGIWIRQELDRLGYAKPSLISAIIVLSASLFWLNSIAAGNISGLLLLLIIYFLVIFKKNIGRIIADALIIILAIIKPQFSFLIFYRLLENPSSKNYKITSFNLTLIAAPYLYAIIYYSEQMIQWLSFIRENTIGGHDDGLLLMRYINNKLPHRQIIGAIIFLSIYVYTARTYIEFYIHKINDKHKSIRNVSAHTNILFILMALLMTNPRYNDYDIFAVYVISSMLVIFNNRLLQQMLFVISIFLLLRLVNYFSGGNYFYSSASSYLMIYLIYTGIKSFRSLLMPISQPSH